MKKKALLAVSFGTSYNESREKTIGAVERELAYAFPEYDVKRAFTSHMIIKKLKERDGLVIDDVEQALGKLLENGYDELLIQPSYVMSGIEYDEMLRAAEGFRAFFSEFAIGHPLLREDEDYDQVVNVIVKETDAYAGPETAFVLMGHGTEHSVNEVYRKLSRRFVLTGHPNYLVGTVEEPIELEEVKEKLKQLQVKKVVLLPLMIVAGDHAHNDMAGDEEGSWMKEFEKEGYEVVCLIRGLGEYEGIRGLFVRHAVKAAKAAKARRLSLQSGREHAILSVKPGYERTAFPDSGSGETGVLSV